MELAYILNKINIVHFSAGSLTSELMTQLIKAYNLSSYKHLGFINWMKAYKKIQTIKKYK